MFSLYQKILFQVFLSFIMLFFVFLSILIWFKILEGQSILTLDYRSYQPLITVSAFLSTLWHLSHLEQKQILFTFSLLGYPPFSIIKILLSFSLLICIFAHPYCHNLINPNPKSCIELSDRQSLCWDQSNEAYLLGKEEIKYPLIQPNIFQHKPQGTYLILELLCITSLTICLYHFKINDKYSLSILFSLFYFIIQRFLS